MQQKNFAYPFSDLVRKEDFTDLDSLRADPRYLGDCSLKVNTTFFESGYPSGYCYYPAALLQLAKGDEKTSPILAVQVTKGLNVTIPALHQLFKDEAVVGRDMIKQANGRTYSVGPSAQAVAEAYCADLLHQEFLNRSSLERMFRSVAADAKHPKPLVAELTRAAETIASPHSLERILHGSLSVF